MKTALSQDLMSLDPDNALTEVGILVVDEDPAFQLGLKTFLKEYVGFEKVFTARNGREAIDLINRESCIELLTLDYQMPEMDGLELLEHLQRDAPRPLAITMITGFPSEDLKREFAKRTSSKLLTNHFLSKPVEFEKLEPVILDCYEELKRSQQLTETLTGCAPEEFAGEDAAVAVMASNRELLARFEALEKKIDAAAKTLQSMAEANASRAFWSGLTRLLLLAVLSLIAWQSGFLQKGLNQIRSMPVFSGPPPRSQTVAEPGGGNRANAEANLSSSSAAGMEEKSGQEHAGEPVPSVGTSVKPSATAEPVDKVILPSAKAASEKLSSGQSASSPGEPALPNPAQNRPESDD